MRTMHPLFISQEVSRFHYVEEVLNVIRSGYFRTKEEPEMNKIFRFVTNIWYQLGQVNNKHI